MARLSGARRAAVLDQMWNDFMLSCAHFHLSTPARIVAWGAAQESIGNASRCYRAIANSLRLTDLGGKVRAVKQRKVKP